ncbi:MAG: transcriptional repressor LexA [Elusimicrobia bacterium]|nr:transcriptional repressor LexA [Candidatus Liberimonas magnetica]
MEKQELTNRQQEILGFIKESINSKGFPPSVKEVQVYFGFKSPTAAQDHLNMLARKGYILRHPYISRGIEIVAEKERKQENIDSSSIPVVGHISAGTPILAQENIEYNISVDKSLFGNAESLFALKVKGDSMINAGIFNGDFAIIHKQAALERGEIGAVLIDDEATLKRVFIYKDTMRLVPENNLMKPLLIKNGEKNISIVGKLKGVIRKI